MHSLLEASTYACTLYGQSADRHKLEGRMKQMGVDYARVAAAEIVLEDAVRRDEEMSAKRERGRRAKGLESLAPV